MASLVARHICMGFRDIVKMAKHEHGNACNSCIFVDMSVGMHVVTYRGEDGMCFCDIFGRGGRYRAWFHEKMGGMCHTWYV